MSAGALERLGLRDVDAVKSRVGGHWSALLDATRAADLDAIHTQLAALHTLADSGCYRCLAQHDPTGLLHFSHQLRTLRDIEVRAIDVEEQRPLSRGMREQCETRA